MQAGRPGIGVSQSVQCGEPRKRAGVDAAPAGLRLLALRQVNLRRGRICRRAKIPAKRMSQKKSA